MASEFTPRCPSCYSDDLRPYHPLSKFPFLATWEPYTDARECATCGKLSHVKELVELRVLEVTTARNEQLAMDGKSWSYLADEVIY